MRSNLLIFTPLSPVDLRKARKGTKNLPRNCLSCSCSDETILTHRKFGERNLLQTHMALTLIQRSGRPLNNLKIVIVQMHHGANITKATRDAFRKYGSKFLLKVEQKLAFAYKSHYFSGILKLKTLYERVIK
jgi:hypothetical protein